MIHIVTVHWKDDRWVDIQLSYLTKNIKAPFKVYAFLNYLPSHHANKYYYSSDKQITSHAIKLNMLSHVATEHSQSTDDWLIFIDGDAFPIGDIVSYGQKWLKDYPLLAIQRRENNGDIQPHPSFCLTTVGFWSRVGGDWKHGYKWIDSNGRAVTDVGGNLLSILECSGNIWHPMLRSNTNNIHPLWFGIYEDLIYHHGAGFRHPFSRIDRKQALHKSPFLRFINRKLPKRVTWYLDRLFDGPLSRKVQQNRILEQEVYRSILSDPMFYRRFIDTDQT